VKRRHPHPAAVGAEERLDARPHLFGGLVRERDGQNFVRLRETAGDEVRHPARDDPRLARSGAGDDEERPGGVEDRVALFGVESL